MKKRSRPEVALQMEKSGLVPLFYHSDAELVKNVIQACYIGGARFFEFTNRGEFAHEVFAEAVKFVRSKCPEMVMGVGSVTDAASASLYMALGAEFIVSPVLREDVAMTCNRRKILYLPGCGTLGEICKAEELGCEIIKLFPADTYGPGFVKAIKGPQPWTSIMPSGGVTTDRDNLVSWFDSGVSLVGMGSALITKEIVTDENFNLLKKIVSEVVETIRDIRK